MKLRIFSSILLLLFIISCGGDKAKEKKAQKTLVKRPPKYVILVIDISSSMSRPAKNIFPKVKESVQRFLDPLQSKDIVQIITFAKNTKIYPPNIIRTEDSKSPIVHQLEQLKANGTATYTSLMIKRLFDLSKKIKQEYPNYFVQAVVFSDGYDYPPKGKRRISINEYAKKDSKAGISDWFVHYIALGILDKKVAQKLKTIAPKTKFHKIDIDKKNKDSKNNLNKVTENINKKDDKEIKKHYKEETNWFTHPIAIVIYLLLIGLIVAFILWRRKQLILEGYLAFWKTEDYRPETLVFNMTELQKGKILIGRDAKTTDLEIPDFNSREPIMVYAAFENSQIVPKIKWNAKTKRNFKFHVSLNSNFLSDGDIFSAGNYTFKYNK